MSSPFVSVPTNYIKVHCVPRDASTARANSPHVRNLSMVANVCLFLLCGRTTFKLPTWTNSFVSLAKVQKSHIIKCVHQENMGVFPSPLLFTNHMSVTVGQIFRRRSWSGIYHQDLQISFSCLLLSSASSIDVKCGGKRNRPSLRMAWTDTTLHQMITVYSQPCLHLSFSTSTRSSQNPPSTLSCILCPWSDATWFPNTLLSEYMSDFFSCLL